METFSALLAFRAGNSPVTGEFPARKPWRRALIFSLICAWTNKWAMIWCRWFETPSRSLWRHCNEKQYINHNLVRRQRIEVIYCKTGVWICVEYMFITSPVLYVDNVMQASIFKPWQARNLVQHELAINNWHVIHQCHSLSREYWNNL